MDKLTAYQRGNRDALVEVLNHLRAAEQCAGVDYLKASAAAEAAVHLKFEMRAQAWARWHAWQQALSAMRIVENLAATTPDDPEGA